MEIVRPTSERSASDVHEGDVVHAPSLSGSTHRLRVDKAFGPKDDGSRNVDVTNLATGRTSSITLQGSGKLHVVETKS